MSLCPHCAYSDEGHWQECPSCGQYTPAAASSAPPGAGAVLSPAPPGPQPGYGPPPYGGSAPGAYPPPAGDNPYAAPTAPGAPPAAYGYAYSQPALLPTSGKAIASMVLGILSILLYFMGFILGPLAIGLWASARNDFKQVPPAYKGQGMATAGLVTGIIGTLFGLLMIFGIILAIALSPRGM